MASKDCRICGRLFRPDPRTGARQRVCGRARCQRERKRRKVRRWRARHLEGVKFHRVTQKLWAKAYPDYWRHYRAAHPAYRRREALRRAEAQRRLRRSANETHWREIAVDKLRLIAELRGAGCSANETQIARRVEAIEDCLLTTGVPQMKPAWPWAGGLGDNAAP